MNEAKTLLDKGDLSGAIDAALNLVKAKPTDTKARTFLFELSCFSGDWERAEKQLEVIGQQDINAMVGSEIFKQNFSAERDRVSAFTEGLIPECLMQPPNYVEGLLEAMTYIRENDLAKARETLDKVEETRPVFGCKVNGEESGDLRDYNDMTMCVFEAIVKGSYTWLPFEQIENVKFEPAVSLRDVYWRQAEIEMTNGTQGEMFLPSLYAESFKNENADIKLGKATDWRELGEDIFAGEGLRLFQYEGGYIPMTELKTIEFVREEESEEEAGEELADEATSA
ncbi:MAG: hypothetical protein HKN25_18190 [Pyrinomonadaceae bacterium]|nr:hypothetical protein [Pyrinomonadaceae bacterium]